MSWWRRSSNSWCCSASWRNCWSLCSRKFFTSCASAALITPPSFIAKGPIRRLLARYHSGRQTLNGSCSAGSGFRWVCGIVAPQDQRVFHRVGVVVPASARNVEAQTLVQAPRSTVARAHFERRASGTKPTRFSEDVVHQRGSVPESAVLRTQRDVVDVDLVEH